MPEMSNLKASIKSLNLGDGYAMKALNNFDANKSIEASKLFNNMKLLEEKVY